MLLKALPVFRDPDVAALSWAIASAPLVKENCGELPIIDEEWCDQQLELHLDWLKQLDSDPSSLKNFIQDDDTKLLGKRFESLLAFWFQQSPHFELIGRSIRFESSGASGEADFLIRDLTDGELIHLEAACKYYIGMPYSPKRNTWVGPNGIDSLQLKVEKLRKQVNLFRTAPGKKFLEEHGLEIPGRAVLLKGYFFHPLQSLSMPVAPADAHRHYSAGWYIHRTELAFFEHDPEQWLVLPKSRWMCPFHFHDRDVSVLNGREMIEQVHREMNLHQKAVLIIQVERSDNMLHELSRGFVIR